MNKYLAQLRAAMAADNDVAVVEARRVLTEAVRVIRLKAREEGRKEREYVVGLIHDALIFSNELSEKQVDAIEIALTYTVSGDIDNLLEDAGLLTTPEIEVIC